MMPFPEAAAEAIDAFAIGVQVAVARVGQDGTAELALYERADGGWRLIGDGWGAPTALSLDLVRGYDDVMRTSPEPSSAVPGGDRA